MPAWLSEQPPDWLVGIGLIVAGATMINAVLLVMEREGSTFATSAFRLAEATIRWLAHGRPVWARVLTWVGMGAFALAATAVAVRGGGA